VRAGATTTRTDGERSERARAFDLGVFERAAERLERTDRAILIAHPTLPGVPHLNTVVLRAPMGAAEAEALADELQGGLPFRRLLVEDEGLASELAARGWSDDPLMLLGRDGSLEPPAAGALAEEVPYGHVRGLRDEWLRSEPWARSEAVIADAHEADRRLFSATPARAFATFEQGRPLAYALLLDGGRDGMLEDVYTTPPARGRGLGTAVIAAVLHAARAERLELVFVPTDADGRSRPLYERLGFEPLAIVHRLINPHPPQL
jgi:GNAT superfamily N-acetyltransferase